MFFETRGGKGRGEEKEKTERKEGREEGSRRRGLPTSIGQPGPGEEHSDSSCTSVANKVLCLELRTEPGQDGEEVTGYTLYVITTQ